MPRFRSGTPDTAEPLSTTNGKNEVFINYSICALSTVELYWANKDIIKSNSLEDFRQFR